MANAEHLEILKQGVEVWNEWKRSTEIDADLSGADLSSIKMLGEADFTDTDLSHAIFVGCELSKSSFYNAILADTIFYQCFLYETIFLNTNAEGATFIECELDTARFIHNTNLKKADFKKSKLFGVGFIECNLEHSSFIEALLDHTSFQNVELGFANFTSAFLGKTIFSLTDLSLVKGLAEVYVESECSIDFQTLRDSQNLPKTFLQKIGLPENYINYLPDFFDEKPIRMHPAFLSHSWQDKPFATKLYEALIKRNVLVWYDERKLMPGDDIREGISKGIDLYDKFILVCSKHSLQESWWVDKELNLALQKEERLFKEKGKQINTIIPITIDDYVHKEWDSAKRSDIQRYVIGDFKDWQDDAKFEKALDTLVAALNADRGEERVVSYL